MLIHTIGHSNHPIEKLVGLVTRYGVDTVADVRSHPSSRFNPQFNRERLRTSLAAGGVDYQFLGRELGARPTDEACYVDGKVSYERLAQTEAFRRGIERVAELAAGRKVALLCAERDPLTCHRTILVCPQLAARGFRIEHILADGSVESHAAALERLAAELGLEQPDLFEPGELGAEAARRRGRDIAYDRDA